VREAKPSATAALIAWATLVQSHLPERAALVPAGAAELCSWFVETLRPRSLRRIARTSPRRLRWEIAFFEAFSIPGIALHYLARKRFLEEAVRAALAAGVRQVVVLGAGYDTLCLRLHREFPAVAFVECDHPATQGVKLRALAARDAVGENLRFVAADFTRVTLEEALGGLPGFVEAQPTVMVAEGLTMYLTEAEVLRLFAFLAARGGAGSRFAFTFLEPRDDGRIDFRRRSPLVAPWLRLVGEPFVWGARRDELAALLAPTGFVPLAFVGDSELRERYLRPLGLAAHTLAAGEAVGVAIRQRV
jgi:methyltransferase (TIGR00027 family)